MADSRRTFMRKALAASGLITVSTYVGSSAAQNCTKQTRLLGWGASMRDGRTFYSIGIPEWGLGDCEIRNVVIDTVAGTGVGNFRAEVATHFTHSKDVWHFQLELFTGDPNVPSQQTVLFNQTWDGSPMSERDNPKFHP